MQKAKAVNDVVAIISLLSITCQVSDFLFPAEISVERQKAEIPTFPRKTAHSFFKTQLCSAGVGGSSIHSVRFGEFVLV